MNNLLEDHRFYFKKYTNKNIELNTSEANLTGNLVLDIANQ